MSKEKLYDAFGELIYVVAMADGLIQKEEIEALEEILKGHPWAREIEWSFKYESEHEEDINYLYKKVLDFCHQHGPDPEYDFLIDVLKKIAEASHGTDATERAIIKKFAHDLTERFKRDLNKIK